MAWTTVPQPKEDEEQTIKPKQMTDEEIRELINEKLKELRSK